MCVWPSAGGFTIPSNTRYCPGVGPSCVIPGWRKPGSSDGGGEAGQSGAFERESSKRTTTRSQVKKGERKTTRLTHQSRAELFQFVRVPCFFFPGPACGKGMSVGKALCENVKRNRKQMAPRRARGGEEMPGAVENTWCFLKRKKGGKEERRPRPKRHKLLKKSGWSLRRARQKI